MANSYEQSPQSLSDNSEIEGSQSTNETMKAEESERISYIMEHFGEECLSRVASAAKTMYETTERNSIAIAEDESVSPEKRAQDTSEYLNTMEAFVKGFGTAPEGNFRTLDAEFSISQAVDSLLHGETNNKTEKQSESFSHDKEYEMIGAGAKFANLELYRIMQKDLVAIGKQPGETEEKRSQALDYADTMSVFAGFFDQLVPEAIRKDAVKSLVYTQKNYKDF